MGWFTPWRTRALSAADQARKDKYFPHPLVFEDKTTFHFPLSNWERIMSRTEAEAEAPGEWFSPFRQARRLPGWLHAKHPFFTGDLKLPVTSLFKLNSGAEGWQIEIPTPKFTLNACIWLYEALCAQCVFERWRRGYPVAHEIEGFIYPEMTDDGWPIVEKQEREDGSVWATVTEFGELGAAPDEIRSFKRAVGHHHVATPYKGKFRLETISPWNVPYEKYVFLVGYPFGRPQLRPVRLSAPDPDRNPYTPPAIIHGSAQWAWRDELARAGMIDAGDGSRLTGHTFLGLSYHHQGSDKPAMNHLTCWTGDGHRLIVGPPGSGKFTSAIAPLLLHSADRDSAFVLDVKDGEAAKITGEHRATLGPVTVLDPFGISGRPSGAINPLDLLRPDKPKLVATAARLAEAIFVPSSAADQFWDHAAKKMLSALLLHVGTARQIGTKRFTDAPRNLRTLRNIVRESVPEEVLEEMFCNEAGDGAVNAQARSIIDARKSGADNMLHSVMATLDVNIGFLNVPEVLTATAETSFDPRQLRERISTLYVVLPDHELAAVSRWVRLIYTYVMDEMRDAKVPDPYGPGSDGCKYDYLPRSVHVVLDEFPALGKFERVAQDMAQTRSLGVHMHVVVQTFQQLQETYGRGWERFQGTSACTHVLGVRDNFTAEQVSKLLGTTTVKTSGQSQTRGNSGGSQSESSNYAARALMTPDELLAMPAERCLAVVGGMNPVRLEKTPYFLHP
jgi:type IV secretion system protein VirD4